MKSASPVEPGKTATRQGEKPKKRANPFVALIAAMRPRQWIKNLLLFAAVIFSDNLPSFAQGSDLDLEKLRLLGAAAAGFAIFCMLSSGVYLLNDVRDIERDRQHPKKRNRPIAAGLVSPHAAVAAAVGLWVFALGMGVFLYEWYGLLSPKFALLAGLYLAMQFAYTLSLKNIAILDVCIIASGFVIRAMAGAAAISSFISTWLVVCTGLLSLLVGFGKRRHELVLLGDDRSGHRANLSQYSVGLIDQLVTLAATGTIVTYSIYTIQSHTANIHPRLWWTIPPVVYAVFRYMYILHSGTKGGAPERDLFEDKHVLISILVWVLLTLLVFYLPDVNLLGEANRNRP